MVTEYVFIQKAANMIDRVSPVEINYSMHIWGNVTGKYVIHWQDGVPYSYNTGHTRYLAAHDGFCGINWSSYILTNSNSQTNQQPNPENCTFQDVQYYQ
jgi:hypothetical protein